MARPGIQLNPEKFFCLICQNSLKDPVTIPCGHSYCMNCIKSQWDEEDRKGTYSCPECRKTFTPKPDLVKNMLTETVEELQKKKKKTGLQDAHCYAGPEDVSCDNCIYRKRKAVKSCLDCPASYCEEHLQLHTNLVPLKKHKLINPSKNLQETICTRHDEVMKIFCRTDLQSICYHCALEEHEDHKKVPAEVERTEKQKELEVSRLKILQRIQDREKDVKVLHQEVEAINGSADKAVEDNEQIFNQLIHLFQKRSSDVEQQIRSQQKTEVSRVKDLQEKLEQEISVLKRKDAELEQLSKTEDHNQFLRNYLSLSALSESTHSSSIDVHPLSYFEDVTAALSKTKDKLQNILAETWTNISLRVAEVDILLSPSEPKTREEFLKYSCEITLDPNTAHAELLLSEGNRKVTRMTQEQGYCSHADRFTYYCQVVSRESLTSRCYWEVKWTRTGGCVAVTYKSISRVGKSDECRFGWNKKSWSLLYDNGSFKYRYNKISTHLESPFSSRIGVFLDQRAGILSFYSISETMTLLHRVQTTFTQPLYAGLSLGNKTTAEFLKLK